VTAELPVREDLRASTPYGAPQLDVPVRLNTNENSYDVPQDVALAVVEAVAREVQHLNRYPDREFGELRAALAGYLAGASGCPVAVEQVWAANGSNEVLQQLLQAFGGAGRRALGFTPAYSMHPRIAQVTGTEWVDGQRAGPLVGDFDLTAAAAAEQVAELDPDVVFLCSPNNPTGTAIGLDVVESVYAASDHAMVVVDEAYAEFARAGTPSALELLPGRPRLVVTRTMSKAFAFAGARLGYLAADPAVADALRLVRLPYHLSALTQAAACAAIAHAPTLLATVEAIKTERDRIVAELPGLGLFAVPSDANFVLFGGLDDEQAAWAALLDRGVLVRDVGLPGHLRVTAGTRAETSAFLTALGAVTAGGSASVRGSERSSEPSRESA
jgi:histidinol-phosphate aminotransferase